MLLRPAALGVLALATTATAVAQQTCTSSAWTGTVAYSKSYSMSDSKTTDRVSNRGKDERNFEMNYHYKAIAAVTPDPANKAASRAKATISYQQLASETSTATERNSCDRGKTWQEMSGNFTSESKTTGQGKDEANVTVGVNDDGTYTVSMGAPSIKGVTSGKQTSAYSGQCTKKEGKTLTLPDTPTEIQGGSLTSDGKNRVDPKNPNRLSGSFSQTIVGMRETITWNLQKCGAPLRLTDLTFEHMKFPHWDNWQEISEQMGTVDGNWVRIKATVFNASAEEKSAEIAFKGTYKGDKWDGARPDETLNKDGGRFSVSVGPGEAKEVELLWDSSGYSWYDDGRPRYVQRIKAELVEKSKVTDQLTRNIKVAAKPVILANGPWTDWRIFESWQNILTTSNSYDWKAFPVGEQAGKGALVYSAESGDIFTQNAQALKNYIRYAQESRNAWHVDIVGHSVGGLVARQYISGMMPEWYPDGRPQVTHLLMLGTPNLGTPCAKDFEQLTPEAMEAFNRQNANRNGVKFSALGGHSSRTACLSVNKGDGKVPLPSALWNVADKQESDSDHEDLASTKDFSDFVKKRLAIGPSGDHLPDMPTVPVTPGL